MIKNEKNKAPLDVKINSWVLKSNSGILRESPIQYNNWTSLNNNVLTKLDLFLFKIANRKSICGKVDKVSMDSYSISTD